MITNSESTDSPEEIEDLVRNVYDVVMVWHNHGQPLLRGVFQINDLDKASVLAGQDNEPGFCPYSISAEEIADCRGSHLQFLAYGPIGQSRTEMTSNYRDQR